MILKASMQMIERIEKYGQTGASGYCGETVEEIAEAALKKYDRDVHSRMTQQRNRRWFFIVAMW
jgi:hypothetical protein